MAVIQRLGSEFIGVPVLLQLNRPLLVTQVTEVRALTHASDPGRQWIPIEARAEDGQSLAATEFIRYAVIKAIDHGRVVFQWVAPGSQGEVVVESMIAESDIAAVTRIISNLPLPEDPKLIKL